MAYFANLICSENATTKGDDLIIEQPLVSLVLDTFPNNYSFFVGFSLVQINKTITQQDYVMLSLFDQEDDEIFSTGKINIPLPDDLDEPLDNFTANVSFNNIKFHAPGLYKMTASSSLADAKTTYFTVRED